MVLAYIRLLNKLLESPAEARVIVYMHLLLTPLFIQQLKASRLGKKMEAIRSDARDFLHLPDRGNKQKVLENIRYFEDLQEDA